MQKMEELSFQYYLALLFYLHQIFPVPVDKHLEALDLLLDPETVPFRKSKNNMNIKNKETDIFRE